MLHPLQDHLAPGPAGVRCAEVRRPRTAQSARFGRRLRRRARRGVSPARVPAGGTARERGPDRRQRRLRHRERNEIAPITPARPGRAAGGTCGDCTDRVEPDARGDAARSLHWIESRVASVGGTMHGSIPRVACQGFPPCKEMGQPCRVRPLSFTEMREPGHLALHPFGQIPTYGDGDQVSRRDRDEHRPCRIRVPRPCPGEIRHDGIHAG